MANQSVNVSPQLGMYLRRFQQGFPFMRFHKSACAADFRNFAFVFPKDMNVKTALSLCDLVCIYSVAVSRIRELPFNAFCGFNNRGQVEVYFFRVRVVRIWWYLIYPFENLQA